MSAPLTGQAVTARAGVNIALVKYWGKAPARGPEDLNLPAVPSLSLTLDGLTTETTVRFAPELPNDRIVLDGRELDPAALGRARPVLDRVRALGDLASPFDVVSTNHVPTGAGLASSASGMAALAAATARLAGLELSPGQLSAVARLGSGSASRSIFGGFAAWEGPEARAVAPPSHWDVRLVVAVVDAGPKDTSSRDAMGRTARTSPYHAGWVSQARGLFDEGLAAVLARDLPALAEVMELSTLRMHAAAMAARPPVLYWRSASLAALEALRALGVQGLVSGWTMDAGPNVKALVHAADAERVRGALAEVAGVQRVLVCAPGPGVSTEVVARDAAW
ncbi:MAG: diphosphomevalonate decarboxylase [Deltaproteobacteria bacterium]|nr:diphosphomevalonate decarboxylase [Deltaproteobacteria bacterium]MCB9788821.1 diphosphomevalonate decarboxylase [Deltaproteobacteria bacterium]